MNQEHVYLGVCVCVHNVRTNIHAHACTDMHKLIFKLKTVTSNYTLKVFKSENIHYLYTGVMTITLLGCSHTSQLGTSN
jgi:hypothetical protein